MPLRIAVCYNDDDGLDRGEAIDRLAARGVVGAAEAVADACRENGWEPILLPVRGEASDLLDGLARAQADAAFNLVEAVGGDTRLEAACAWLFELSHVPYTGSGPLALAVGLEKPVAKAVMASRGVPVPKGRLLERGDEPLADLDPPLIVKPSREDASHGISKDSVVWDAAAARERARYVIRTYDQPALVEEFIDGREFNVSVLGENGSARLLPLAEIDFDALPPDHPRLMTYEAKWVEESVAYGTTPSMAARPIEAATADRIEEVVLAAYRAVGLRDYGRVDIRLHPTRGPIVLEVNPNPDLTPDAGVARTASRAGIAYATLIAGIVEAALARVRHHPIAGSR